MSETPFTIDLKGLELLVVEDDATSALLISRMLAKYGARVETAADGNEALLKFQDKRYPIIITDINMPGMNGLDLAGTIKKLDQDVQFIAISANSQTDCLVTAIELSFSEYLLKPLKIEKLLLAVKRCGDIITIRHQLENEREKFRTVVECLGEGIAVKDLDFRILYQNSAMTRIFGDWTGAACYEIFDLDAPCQDCPVIRTLEDHQTHSDCRTYRHNGTATHIEVTSSLLRDSFGNITGTIEIVRDISERVKNEQTIRDLAFLDPLTGLSNRRLFEDRLEQAIAKSRRYEMQFGLISLDLDHFKDINDSYGHEVGDQVLLEAAERIKACCKRDVDTICRQGGDEFCIIFTDCEGKEQLTAIAEKLLEQFARPFLFDEMHLNVTTSIGISIFPAGGSRMKELEIASDRAMYEAKRSGRNTYRFSPPETV
jgi:diguanylate cyclase (GGDEF)-like protein/PAS domain S-box-containing protein